MTGVGTTLPVRKTTPERRTTSPTEVTTTSGGPATWTTQSSKTARPSSTSGVSTPKVGTVKGGSAKKRESPGGKEWELPDITNWDEAPEEIAQKVILIEERFHGKGPSEKVNFDVDPDPDAGVVTIEYKGWTLKFEP